MCPGIRESQDTLWELKKCQGIRESQDTLWELKCVQEYERAVIFRLGRLLTSGARGWVDMTPHFNTISKILIVIFASSSIFSTKGPGVFFIIPCIDMYEKIDMRTQTYNVPPQEV